jgi:hypothetical protein
MTTPLCPHLCSPNDRSIENKPDIDEHEPRFFERPHTGLIKRGTSSSVGRTLDAEAR